MIISTYNDARTASQVVRENKMTFIQVIADDTFTTKDVVSITGLTENIVETIEGLERLEGNECITVTFFPNTNTIYFVSNVENDGYNMSELEIITLDTINKVAVNV